MRECVFELLLYLRARESGRVCVCVCERERERHSIYFVNESN